MVFESMNFVDIEVLKVDLTMDEFAPGCQRILTISLRGFKVCIN